MTRMKAFSIHLGISSVIFLVLLFLLIFVWYPFPYFGADGGWQGLRIIAGVDMVLGPLLTLLVFRSGKPGLKLDLTAIGVLQAAALAWGIWTVHDQRTALVVFADGGFYSLNSEQIQRAGNRGVEIARDARRAPGYAFVRLPKDKKAALKEKMAIFRGAPPLFLRGDSYEPVTPANIQEILAHALDMEKLLRHHPEDRKTLENFLSTQNRKVEDFAFVPLHCRYKDLLLVWSRDQGKIIDSLDIDPAPLFYF